jgi:hypothetical protein
MLRIAEVVESNYQAEPAQNRAGRAYPRTHAYIRMPWLATPENPDPVSPHPVPVFAGQQHQEGRLDWLPLKPGTRVVVAELADRRPPNNLAIIAYGPPNTDDLYPDLRETVEYRKFPGNAGEDRYVDEVEDPVFGPNEDVGRTHLDGRGYGWQTRHPYPGDMLRDEKFDFGPATTIKDEHRLDQSVVRRVMTIPGPTVTYTVTYDAVAGTYTLADDKGNSVTLDSVAMTLTLAAVTSIGFDTAAMGFFGAAPVAKPTVAGSKTAVEGVATPALTSLIAALASLGLVTDSTT